jgi:catechol 2,3-dioxygenase
VTAPYRLPAATHVGAVHLLVSDLTRSIEYYERALGLRSVPGADGAIDLLPHGDDRVLLRLESRPGTVRARRGAIGLYHFAILLPDRASLGAFTAHLAGIGERAGMADHLVSEALYLWDPDGLGIEVYADRPRETWQRRGDEVAMTVDPLDVDGLIAAATAPWRGMPAGSVMGHVHLHVGDLQDATAFYHRGLGFDRTAWSLPGALFLAAGGYHHHLGTNTWSRGAPARDPEARLLEWQLIVPASSDVDAVARSLEAVGVRGEPSASGLIVADPWGTRVRVRAADRG